jgi:pantetheine-phosphate adenylyltransferase
LENIKNIEVIPFSGLLVDFATKLNAKVILRGLRVVSDFEYEFQMSSMNKKLNNNIESIFLTPSESYAFLSSSLVKEIAQLGGDVSTFVNKDVKIALEKKYK